MTTRERETHDTVTGDGIRRAAESSRNLVIDAASELLTMLADNTKLCAVEVDPPTHIVFDELAEMNSAIIGGFVRDELGAVYPLLTKVNDNFPAAMATLNASMLIIKQTLTALGQERTFRSGDELIEYLHREVKSLVTEQHEAAIERYLAALKGKEEKP